MENGLLASPKASTSAPATPDHLDSISRPDSVDGFSSSSASTPDSMTPDFTPHISSAISIPRLSSPTGPMGLLPSNLGLFHSTSAPSALDLSFGIPSSSSSNHQMQGAVKLEPFHTNPGLFSVSPITQGPVTEATGLAPPFQLVTPPRNRVISLSLWADGMAPFEVDINNLRAFTPPGTTQQSDLTSVLLRIKLSISSIDDIHSSPNLHGFQGAIMLSERWNTEAKCITKTYNGQSSVAPEIGYLESLNPATGPPSHALAPQVVTTVLPDSSLSRCKWLETCECLYFVNFVTVTDNVVSSCLPHVSVSAVIQVKIPSPNRLSSTVSFSPPSCIISNGPWSRVVHPQLKWLVSRDTDPRHGDETFHSNFRYPLPLHPNPPSPRISFPAPPMLRTTELGYHRKPHCCHEPRWIRR